MRVSQNCRKPAARRERLSEVDCYARRESAVGRPAVGHDADAMSPRVQAAGEPGDVVGAVAVESAVVNKDDAEPGLAP